MVPPEIVQAGKTGQPLPPKQPQPDPGTSTMAMAKMKETQLKEQKTTTRSPAVRTGISS